MASNCLFVLHEKYELFLALNKKKKKLVCKFARIQMGRRANDCAGASVDVTPK
jgi:hypothetical protein